jgi:CDP-diacylglycerol--serine O-phosphatidyltransferase
MRVTRSLVPNLFTLMNLFMGFSAIVHISMGEINKAAGFILIAAIFDLLDGLVARLLKAASEFGVELDSLCDAVSFGVAPAFMLYIVYFHQFNEIGILLASFPALAGVSRLARFNVQLTSLEDKKFFTGLAIPSGAFMIISYIVYFHQTNAIPDIYKPYMIFIVTIATSLLMVSRIKFHNLPKPSLKSIKEKPIIFSIFVIGLLACIITKGVAIFPFMVFYVVASTIRHFILFLKKKKESNFDVE